MWAMQTAKLGLSLLGDTRCAAARESCALKPGSVRLQASLPTDPRLNNPMKPIYSRALICFLLVGFTLQAQVFQPASPNVAGSPVTAMSAAEDAVLQVASNAVQAATIVRLPNQVLQAAPGAATTTAGATAGFPTVGSGVAIEVVFTHA